MNEKHPRAESHPHITARRAMRPDSETLRVAAAALIRGLAPAARRGPGCIRGWDSGAGGPGQLA
jgi:hypothetical protein